MSDPMPLHRSAEVEDLTNLSEKDQETKRVNEPEKAPSSLHRSEEMEDLAHLSADEMKKPLTTDAHANAQAH